MNDSSKTTKLLKLFMLLIGSKAPQRNVEQHDFYFGIARDLKELVPDIKAFWPEAEDSIHIDAWREVSKVDDYKIEVILKNEKVIPSQHKLFFINLGGYQANKMEEQHYTVLSVQIDRALAISESKRTVFYRTNTLEGAHSHIDDKYGIDVDDVYQIEDILIPAHKEKYQVVITKKEGLPEDEIHPGYFRLNKL
ncbi:MAG: DUF1543 domain-containing protein [Ginsengibacter sp.]